MTADDARPTALAIDTAAGSCSVAIRAADRPLARERVAMARGHAEALLPMVGRVMAAAGIDRPDLSFIAVTVGPGAFTGLRVGLAAARGLALAAAIPCVGVTTLAALAADGGDPEPGDRLRVAVLDTKRGDVYAQAFAPGGDPWEGGLADPVVLSLDDLATMVPAKPVVVVGDVAERVAAALVRRGKSAVAAAGPGLIDADRVAVLAMRRWRQGDRPVRPPAPLYLRAPEAKPAVAGGRRRP